MFIIIPVGHDRQVVQRLPIITFSLIALNMLFFIATLMVGTRQEARLESAIETMITYAQKHAYVTMSAEAEDRLARLPFAQEEMEEIRQALHQRRANYNTATRYYAGVLNEQEEMDRLCAEFVKAYEGFWVFKYGFIPRYHRTTLFNYLSCLFLHGGWMHLIGNMLFLFLAGMAIEDLWGRGVYSAFYLLSGVAATVAHFLFNPQSTIPVIGASGAIAGLMGAFMVRHFKAKVRLGYAYFLFFRFKAGTFEIPAYVVLPFWVLQQLFYATLYQALGVNGGVAFWAHIGGFAFGAAIAAALYHGRIEERYLAPNLEAKISFGTSRAVTEALTHLEKGEAQVALRKLTQQLQTNPDDTDALLALTRVYAQMGEREPEVSTFHRLIRAHLKGNDREAGLEAYGSLLDTYAEGEPQHPLPGREWMLLCEYLNEQNLRAESAGEYEKLARAYPAEPFAVKALICAAEIRLAHLHERDRARELFERAAQLAPNVPAWRTRIAAGLEQLGVA
jgi:membrane associated rhomboid family serine protease